MSEKKTDGKKNELCSEKQEKMKNTSTEAWADVACTTEDAKVAIPTEEGVEDAKEWVEDNEK